MMTNTKGFRGFDVFTFTVASTISIGLAFLPFVSGEEMRSAWLKLIIGAFPFFLFFYLIHLFMKKYDSHDFFGTLKNNMYSGFYFIIIGYFIISLFYAGGVILNGMGLVMETFLLPQTPKWSYILIFMLVSAVGVSYGIEAIGRFVTITIAFDFLILFVICLLGFSDFFRWIYIPPLVSVDLGVLLRASISDIARYSGLVPLLAFIAFVKPGRGIVRSMSIGLIFVLTTYVALSIVVIGTFGFEESIRLVSPFISLIQSFKTDTIMFERLDLFFLSFWLYGFYKIYTIHIWFLTYIVHKSLPKVNSQLTNIVSHSIIFTIVLLLPAYVDKSWQIYNINMIVYSVVVPISLLLFLLWKKRKGQTTYEMS